MSLRTPPRGASLALAGIVAGCASTPPLAPVTAPSPTPVATPAPARPAPDDSPLPGAVSALTLRTEQLQRELDRLPREGSSLGALARDFFFFDLTATERVTEARLDPARPLRSWYGPIDAPVLARLEQLRELGRSLPPEAEGDARALAASPAPERLLRLTESCPAGGFAQRIVWPSLDPAVTARALVRSLNAQHWQPLPASEGFEALRRWNRHAVALGVSQTRSAVAVDLWFEPLADCQAPTDRASFSARAVERLYGLRSATSAPAPAEEAWYTWRANTLEDARRGFATGVMNIFTAIMPSSPELGPIVDPAALPALFLAGLREADSTMQLVGDGRYTTRTDFTLQNVPGGITWSIQSELGDAAEAFPAEALWLDEPTVAVAGARDALDVRTAWLAGFGPLRSPEEWTRLRRQVGYQGSTLMPLHDVANSLRRALRAAHPAGAPWPAPERLDREMAAVVPAADPNAPGARVHVALLTVGTALPVAACALATAPADCAPVRLAVGATRAVSGGFARLLAAGARYVVVVGASRAAVASVALRGSAAAPPCAGTLPAESLGADLRGFVGGPASVEVVREGARITARLRTTAADASPR